MARRRRLVHRGAQDRGVHQRRRDRRSNCVALALSSRSPTQDAEALGERWADHGFVFTTDTGEPIKDRNCLRWWYGRLNASDLEKRPFHAARWTAITNMAEAGVPLEVAASIVGHASIRMTAEVDNRVRPRGRVEAAQLIAQIPPD